eukprot:487287_1
MSACYLGQYETIQELWTLSSGAAKSKFLLCLLDSDTMKSVLCRPEKNEMILQLLFDHAKKPFVIGTFSESVLFEAQHHHLVHIIDHFKNDSDVLYKLMANTNDGKPLFACICESKEKGKHHTIKTLLKHMKVQLVVQLLRGRFKIRDYDPDDNRVNYNEISFRHALMYGVGGDIIEWAKYDRKLLLKLLRIVNNEVEIVNYFARDPPTLIKMLSVKIKSDGDTYLI